MGKNLAYNRTNGDGTGIATLNRKEGGKKIVRHLKLAADDWKDPRRNGDSRSRRYSPKATSFSQISQPKPEESLVKDPERKRYGYKTPDELRAETKDLWAKATITLHEARDGKNGFVGVYLGYPNKFNYGKPTYGPFLLECLNGWARITEAITPIKWLEKYGLDLAGMPAWVKLNPPLFAKTEDSDCQFPELAQRAIIALWVEEEKKALTTSLVPA